MMPITKKIKDMIEEFEDGLAVAPPGSKPPIAATIFTPSMGRVIDHPYSRKTDDDLVDHVKNELRRYKKNSMFGKTIYWVEQPDFGQDFCNLRVRKFYCRVVISERQLVNA